MHTIVRTVSGSPMYFQKDIDELVNELCNIKGYRIAQISNLVQSDTGGYSESRNKPGGYVGEHETRHVRNFELSQTFVFVKE